MSSSSCHHRCRRTGPRVRSIPVPESWATSGVDLHLDLAGTRGRAGAGAGAAGGGADRPAGARHPAAVVPGAGRRPAHRPQHGRRRRTGSWSPRDGWWPGRARAPWSPSGSSRRPPRGSPRRRPRSPGTSLGPARRTSPRSRERPGWRRPGGRWPRRPRTRTATATRAGGPSCAEALADYLARARGVHADAERIVVCAGFTQALGAALRRRCGPAAPGRWRPRPACQPATRDLVAARGLRLATVPVDERGAVPGGAADALLLDPGAPVPDRQRAGGRAAYPGRWAAPERW